jgi:pimeloyl-ACP methyl ester carboxylesterase
MRRFGLLAAAAVLAGTLGAAEVPKQPNPAFELYARPQRLVDIGGRRLNVYCLGQGSPTVILDGGLGNDITEWRDVQGAIARETRVCAYDRAGYGFSDPGPLPRTASALDADLVALLRAAAVNPPYVLVGASLASLHVQLFANRHRSEVAGMVLVDPSFEHQVARYIAATPAFKASAEQQLATFNGCIVALKRGAPAPGTQVYKDCIGDADPDLPADVTAALEARIGPAFYETALSEVEAFNGRSSEEVDTERRSYGDLPLIVLTAQLRAGADADTVTRTKIWYARHDAMAKLSTRGVHRIVAGATHHIARSRPAAVIEAVDEVVAAARGASHT